VDGRAEWNLGERHRVAGPDVRPRTGDHRLPDLEPSRVEDVSALAVLVLDQGDVGATVRIVLDREYPSGNAELAPPEIDDPVLALVAATAAAHGDMAMVVPATLLRQRFHQ
jgi:hypothetical protein